MTMTVAPRSTAVAVHHPCRVQTAAESVRLTAKEGWYTATEQCVEAMTETYLAFTLAHRLPPLPGSDKPRFSRPFLDDTREELQTRCMSLFVTAPLAVGKAVLSLTTLPLTAAGAALVGAASGQPCRVPLRAWADGHLHEEPQEPLMIEMAKK